MYSTYDEECEANPTNRDKIMVIGGGPNHRPGHRVRLLLRARGLALREDGYGPSWSTATRKPSPPTTTPPTVSVLEPVTLEDVLEIVRVEQPKGVIVQYGGQTPLKLARALEANGVPVIGTSPDAIDRAEDRERFQSAVERLGLKQPENGTVTRPGAGRADWPSASPTRWWFVPPTCWVARHGDRL